MPQAASAASPTSSSSWWIQVCQGRPRGRFHSGLISHQVGDLHGRWQPDGVSHARVPILADDVYVRILRYVCHGFCCRCFAAVSVSSLIRLAQNPTIVLEESVVSTTSGKPRVSVHLIVWGSRFPCNTVGQRRQVRCTVAAWWTNLVLSDSWLPPYTRQLTHDTWWEISARLITALSLISLSLLSEM